MTKSLFSAILLLAGLCFNLQAQLQGKAVTDSLEKELAGAGEDSTRARLLQNIGVAHQRQGNFTEASASYFKSLAIAERLKNEILEASLYQGIASVFREQHDYEKSLQYAQKALLLFEKLDNKKGRASVTANIGAVYFEQGKLDQADEYLNKALGLFRETGNKRGEANVYVQLGVLHGPEHQKSLDYKMAAQTIWDEIDPLHPNAIMNTGNIGITYLDIARYDTFHLVKPGPYVPSGGRTALLNAAEKYIRKAITLSEQVDNLNNVMLLTGDLATLNAERKDYAAAYRYFSDYHKLYDSIYSQENKNAIAGVESQREIELRDKTIEISKLQLASERRIRIFFIAGTILLLTLGIVLYRQSRIRKKTNTTLMVLNNQLDEANKVKARFFGILSHDLRSPIANLVNFLELQVENPGLLPVKDAAEHQKNIAVSARSLLENMESMLIWSKSQMENFKPSFQAVPVEELFSYIRKHFADQQGVDFHFSAPAGMTVETDENYLQTIMYNLSSNAVKALANTSNAKITWEARMEQGKPMLSITDNGPGIKKEQLSALEGEIDSVNARNGFGLHLIRDLAKAISCTVSMQSAPGGGTRFTLAT